MALEKAAAAIYCSDCQGLSADFAAWKASQKHVPIGYAPIATISSGHENEKRPICAVALSYEAWCVGRLSPTPRQKLLFPRLAVSCVRKMYGRACRTAYRLSASRKENISALTAVLCCETTMLDWLLQYTGVKKSTNKRRLITGLLGGFGLAVAYVGIIRFVIKR